MRAFILWVSAAILSCCLIFLLVLVTNENELAKFQNGVSSFMQSDKQASSDQSTSDGPTKYPEAAEGQSTQHADAAHKNEAESSSLFVISLTSITSELSHQWIQHFPKQGSSGN
ncbi:hypothetical protein [Staphylococcus simulans]|uniref:hypothetical protein n=1 Tax=Staphylococcus simulans TaxID=1286 RepID=UPI00399B9C29